VKLNMGSGQNPLPGYINVDRDGAPDVLWNLEQFPWPWDDNSVSTIIFNHVLEHLGESRETYLGIFKEIYRVCRDGAHIRIAAPHPRHDNFMDDPTHVRAITPNSLGLFSKANNQKCRELKAANSPLAFYLDVDFELIKGTFNLEEPWSSRLRSGEISEEELKRAMQQYNNVVREIIIELKVVKKNP